MDPLTAALNLATAFVELAKVNAELMKAAPAEQQAAYAKGQLDDAEKWRQFVDSFLKIFHPIKP